MPENTSAFHARKRVRWKPEPQVAIENSLVSVYGHSTLNAPDLI